MAIETIYKAPAWPGGTDEVTVDIIDGSVSMELPSHWRSWVFSPEDWADIVEATSAVVEKVKRERQAAKERAAMTELHTTTRGSQVHVTDRQVFVTDEHGNGGRFDLDDWREIVEWVATLGIWDQEAPAQPWNIGKSMAERFMGPPLGSPEYHRRQRIMGGG